MYTCTRLCTKCRRWRTPAPVYAARTYEPFVCWVCNPYSEWAITHAKLIQDRNPEWTPQDLEIILKPSSFESVP